jgi:hypothetical protein
VPATTCVAANEGEILDQGAVLLARMLLLGSRPLTHLQLVNAYRVLIEASPLTYGPRLVEALVGLAGEAGDPAASRRLLTESVQVARGLDGSEPRRSQLLMLALAAYLSGPPGGRDDAHHEPLLTELVELAPAVTTTDRHHELDASLIGKAVTYALNGDSDRAVTAFGLVAARWRPPGSRTGAIPRR